MTDAHEPNEIDGPHEGPIKTPKQLILAVFYAFVIPIAAIVLLVVFVTSDHRPAAGSDGLGPAATTERIRPVGHVEVKDASDLASMKSGDQVFAGQCSACHASGALNAPKFGDADAWGPRIKTGFDALLHSALAGKGAMPAQGGGDFSDLEVARAVVYMSNKVGANFPEPKAPAVAPTADATATAAPATTAPAGAATATADPNAGAPGSATAAPLNAVATAPTAGPTSAGTQPVIVAAVTAGAAGAPPALYTQTCMVCHGAGIAGAPKFGDKAAWAPRIAQGIDTLTAHAIKGQGAMPPRGGSTASDADIKSVVSYMVGAAK